MRLSQYFSKLEQKVQKVVSDNQDLPAATVSVLVNVILEDMNITYRKLLLRHLRMTETLAKRHTEEIITLQQRKRLGQSKATDDVNFKDFPLTWLSMKAQSTLDAFTNVINPDAPYKIQQNKAVHDYLRDHSITVSEKTRIRINNDIQKILTTSETEGIGNKEVAKKIQQKFQQLETWEARRIARTEINAANNLIAHQELLQNDLVDYKMWVATSDNRTRDTHKELNGEITRIGNPFSNGLQYPGDHNGKLSEFINCRCRVISWIPDYDKIPPTDKEHFREEDCLQLPKDEGQQVVLQLPEDAKLFEVKQGYLEVQAEQLGIKPYGQQSLNSYVEEFKKLFHPQVKETGTGKKINEIKKDVKTKIPKETIKPTDDKELKQLKQKVNELTEQVEQNKYKYQFTPQEQEIYDKLMDKFLSNGGKLKLKKYKPILEGGKLNPKEKQQLTKLHEKKLSILAKKPKTTTKSLEQTNTTQKTKKVANVLSTDEQKELKDITQKYNEELNKFKTNNRELYQLIKNNGYSDVLEKELKEKAGVINNKIINKHKDISKISKDSKYQKLKTNQEIADYFGLKYNKKTGVFTDPKTKTKIIFDKYYTERAGQFIYIDNNNSGKACYDLKEIIKMWYEADDLHKSSVDELRFKYNKSKTDGGKATRTKKGKKIIEIYPKALSSERNSDMNLRRAMYHEIGHTLDYMFGLKRGYPKDYGISNDAEFHEAGIKDLIHQAVNGYPNCNISSYGDKYGTHEQWADLYSMISCERTDKNSAILKWPDGELIDLETFKKRCPYSYEYAVKKFDKLKKR